MKTYNECFELATNNKQTLKALTSALTSMKHPQIFNLKGTVLVLLFLLVLFSLSLNNNKFFELVLHYKKYVNYKNYYIGNHFFYSNINSKKLNDRYHKKRTTYLFCDLPPMGMRSVLRCRTLRFLYSYVLRALRFAMARPTAFL